MLWTHGKGVFLVFVHGFPHLFMELVHRQFGLQPSLPRGIRGTDGGKTKPLSDKLAILTSDRSVCALCKAMRKGTRGQIFLINCL